jgi:long-chain acyl-CoA synthetase
MKMDQTADYNIYAVFDATAQRRGKRTAVIYLGTRYSYFQIKNLAESFAAALQGLGVTPGGRVVLYIPNSVQWVVMWLGIQRVGAVPVPITPIYTPHDLRYITNDSEAKTIVCADTNFGYVKRVLPETNVKRVIVTRMADLLPWWKRYFGYLFNVIPKGKITLEENVHSLRDLLFKYKGDVNRLPELRRDGRARAEILYTGGTTKFPKGVPYTHDLYLVSMAEQITVSEPLIALEENIIFGNAPLFHILGQTCGLATLFMGGTLVLQPKVNLDATFESIERYKAKSMIGFKEMGREIWKADFPGLRSDGNLRRSHDVPGEQN